MKKSELLKALEKTNENFKIFVEANNVMLANPKMILIAKDHIIEELSAFNGQYINIKSKLKSNYKYGTSKIEIDAIKKYINVNIKFNKSYSADKILEYLSNNRLILKTELDLKFYNILLVLLNTNKHLEFYYGIHNNAFILMNSKFIFVLACINDKKNNEDKNNEEYDINILDMYNSKIDEFYYSI